LNPILDDLSPTKKHHSCFHLNTKKSHLFSARPKDKRTTRKFVVLGVRIEKPQVNKDKRTTREKF